MPREYPLSPAMAAFVAASDTFTPQGPTLADQRAAYRALCRAFTPERPTGLEVTEFDLGGVPARLYQSLLPAPTGGWPCLMFIHGGGWMLGDLASHDFICAYLADHLPVAVVAIDYRLAPEHPFPAALDDCLQAWRALSEGAAGIRLDPNRLAVAGDSAGGNLAVALCLTLRDAGQVLPCAQALIYPALSPEPLPSHLECADAPLLSLADLQACLECYLPDPRSRESPLALPLAASHFSGLPPAFVTVAEFDPLRDDGARYAQRLALDGVQVEFDPGHGLVHGCLRGQGQIAEVDRLYCRLFDWLRRAMRLPEA
ncbi:alpha/beta hydrolase [Metapseudomonas boanensis]|uniref:Alpha/beta hydrolase n=1 Tax=Metapseudomonas boanensis TaxID=2822138 RepID=A0ABS5XNL5_9GAMM|nr:alpha/beta hydrolase [Pseudomonas boanensis]MBT8769294.1 alpha/beta hydrolase [Pseudomonas boanensis]